MVDLEQEKVDLQRELENTERKLDQVTADLIKKDSPDSHLMAKLDNAERYTRELTDELSRLESDL